MKQGSRKDKNKRFVDFLSQAKIFALLSLIFTFLSLVGIVLKGFNYGIDFSGGIEVQVQFSQAVSAQQIRTFTQEKSYDKVVVQSIGEDNEFLIRLGIVEGKDDQETNLLLNQLIARVTKDLKDYFSTQNPQIRRVDSVGPQIGSELKRNGLLAAFYSLLLILVYVGLRFDYKYAPGAVFCLFHDSVITLGIFAIFGREVNVQTMAAILTIIGYSLNDTIVTFDRIRENVGVYRDDSFSSIINRSLNDVLSRTLLTSITTLIAVAAMYFLARGVIKDFAFTLAIGVVVGTYSSIYVASPLVLLVDKLEKSYQT